LLGKYKEWIDYEELKVQIDRLTILEHEYESVIEDDRYRIAKLEDAKSKLEN
jgi:hypothetical protein